MSNDGDIFNAERIKELTKLRGNIRRKLTNTKKFLDTYDPATQYPTLVKLASELEICRADFEKVQSELEDLGDGTLTVEGFDEAARNEFDQKYFDAYNRASNLLSANRNIGSVSTPPASTVTSNRVETGVQNESSDNFKLPSLGLPHFSGAYDTWLGFHDVFTSMVDKNERLTPISKFRHLRDCLKGEAAELIASVQLSDENYSVAWGIITETYDNRNLIRQNHIQDLLNIPCMSKEVSVRYLLNNLQKHIRALKILDEPVDDWGSILIVLIKNKMNPSTLEKWDETSCDSERPTLKELIAFLQRRAQLEDTKVAQSRPKTISANEKKSSNSRANIRSQHSFVTSNILNTCPHCKEAHALFSCSAFLNLNPKERFNICKQARLCLNCFNPDHRTSRCKSGSCTKCQKKHNTLLHFERINENVNNESDSIPVVSTHNYLINQTTSENLLSTAIVDIVNKQGKSRECRILLDNASQSHYLTDSVVSFLELHKKPVNISVLTLALSTSIYHSVKATLKSRYNDFSQEIEFLVQNNLNHVLPTIRIDRESLNIPRNIRLADPNFDIAKGIDGIIGVDLFYKLLCIGQIVPKNHPDAVLQKTQLGWIVAGTILGTHSLNPQRVHCNFIQNQPPLNQELTKFWELEEVPNEKVYSAEEIACEEHFVKNTTRDLDGRYVVKLPFNEKRLQIGDSRNVAFRRLYSLENRFRKHPELKAPYVEFINEYEQLGHMSLLDDKENRGFYLPHHAVLKNDSLTTKMRVVFDGSSKSSSGLSLNDALMVGPTIQDDLFTQLIRFRSRKYALTADMEKMYRQVRVHPDDAIFQKIVFRENPEEPIKIYSLNTVTYGTASASFLSIRALHQLADDEGSDFPLAAAALKQDFYVDDLLTGANNHEEAIILRDGLIKILQRGGFNLRKWSSNDSSLIADLENSAEDIHMAPDPSNPVKTLGIHWNSKADTIFYSVNPPDSNLKFSKRLILSQVAKLFDPLGLLGPVIVFAKLIIQLLWKAKITWDEGIPPSIYTLWTEYISQLSLLNESQFKRIAIDSSLSNLQLHGFCDASERAYGACIYLRYSDPSGQHYSNLLCSKSKVAPIKTVSLARLELCAAFLLSKLQNVVCQSLKFDFSHKFFWSDSTICLQWLNTSPHLLKTFCANRVSKIQNLTDTTDWRHVPSLDNPADLVSRGQMPQEFLNSGIWPHGPSWLVQPEGTWPEFTLQLKNIPELRSPCPNEISMILTINKWNILEKYSSFSKLKRVVAYCLRFLHNAKGKKRLSGPLTMKELDESMYKVLKLTQAEAFSKEITALCNGQNISSKSKLLSLNPFLDNGILRVGGRLTYSELTPDKKHPVLLPSSHHITSSIIRDEHLRLRHAGTQATLYSVRELFWPIDGRNTTRHIIRQCVPCFRAKPRSVNHIMGNLPANRLNYTRPFCHTGIDYCGPFFIKEKRHRNRNKIKCYVAVFICLASKAMHLELVSDLTTEAFLAALKRFFSRRGKSSSLISDNATNFTGASRELKELQTLIISDEHNKEVLQFLVQQKVEWKFIPARAPHFGGLWEAGVKSFKHHLLCTVGVALLTFEQLQTYMIEIEAILNSRPLSPLSSDPNDYRPLTPGHLLIGEPLTSFSQASLSHVPVNRLSAWQHVQLLRQHFWTRWHKEYLNEITTRSKWKSGCSDIISIGSLVVLKEDNSHPLHWTLGRVIAVHPGDDNIIRVVTVKTEGGIYKRSVKKVCPLPIMDPNNSKNI